MSTEIFAHRGSKCNRPENTLAAYKEACRVGCDGIELDVHLSKDQQLVVIHDEKVDRTTNAQGLIRDYTINELKSFDAGGWYAKEFIGERIPLLSEVFDLLVQEGFTGKLNIEVKTDKFHYPGIERILLDFTESKSWPFQIIYSSFNFDSLAILHNLKTKSDLAALVKNKPFKIHKADRLPYISALHLRSSYFIAAASLLHRPCRLWTANRPATMKQLLRKKAEAIITDYPEEAMKLRAEYEKSLPNRF